jgi:hypothetical protein
MKGMMKMTTFEKVITCFTKMKEAVLIPICFDPNRLLKVYDKENDLKPAWIKNIFKDPDGNIGIEILYMDDNTIRFYSLCDDSDIVIPESNYHPEYRYDSPSSFDYLFTTEERMSKLMKKVWPNTFDGEEGLRLEYIGMIDLDHANYKFIWIDGNNRKNEFIVSISRDDVNELLDDSEGFMYDLMDAIHVMGLWPPKDEDEE